VPPVAAVASRLPRPGHGGPRRAGRQRGERSPRWPPRSRPAARPLAVKLADVADAVAAGADEVDMVIDRGAVPGGRRAGCREIRAVREAVARACLKVILETGELEHWTTWPGPRGWPCCPGPTSSRPRPARSPRPRHPGHPGHAGRRGRLRGGYRPPGRGQGGRRGTHRQGRASATWSWFKETAGPEWLTPGPLPHRRLQPSSTTSSCSAASSSRVYPTPTTSRWTDPGQQLDCDPLISCRRGSRRRCDTIG